MWSGRRKSGFRLPSGRIGWRQAHHRDLRLGAVLGGSKRGGNLKLVSRLGDLQIIQTLKAGSGDDAVVQKFDAGLTLETDNGSSAIVQGRDRLLGGLVSDTVSPPKLIWLQSVIKRGLDVVLASVLLIATLPISVTIAAIIAISCGLPVLFKQKRVTKGGRPFTMLKFRTMRMNANRLLSEAHADQTVPFFKVEGDPRITRIGALLRKCSLDELPQLLNVFRGDMSLVGPRPLPVEQVEANRELLMARHEVRAGITGWWQVNGRNNMAPDQAVALDRFYVENWSLALDLRILLRTPRAVLTRRGAY
jgi:lipopolysaccharide/colanic/teichoic acid biosynthesis glycosyltransferase